MLEYNPTTSAVTKIAMSGIMLRFLVMFMKPSECLIYDQPFCMIDFKWWSRNSEDFYVGLPQLEIASLPGTLWSLLWIVGKRYNLLKLVAFLKSQLKYFICFSVKKSLYVLYYIKYMYFIIYIYLYIYILYYIYSLSFFWGWSNEYQEFLGTYW